MFQYIACPPPPAVLGSKINWMPKLIDFPVASLVMVQVEVARIQFLALVFQP